MLVHPFTAEGYLGFLSQFDDEDEFTTLPADQRAALEHALLERLRRLPADALVMRMPIVYASGIRTPR
jgi:hypothetical protein